jgi:hypothetical protein
MRDVTKSGKHLLDLTGQGVQSGAQVSALKTTTLDTIHISNALVKFGQVVCEQSNMRGRDQGLRTSIVHQCSSPALSGSSGKDA